MEEIVSKWPFRKGLIIASPLDFIYTIFGLGASMAGYPGSHGWAQARSSLVRTTALNTLSKTKSWRIRIDEVLCVFT